jgi:hypothetical protein
MNEQIQTLIKHLRTRFEEGQSCYLSHEEVGMVLEYILHPPLQLTIKHDEETERKTLEALEQMRTGNVTILHPQEMVQIVWDEAVQIPEGWWDAAEKLRINPEVCPTIAELRSFTQEEIKQMAENYRKSVGKAFTNITGEWKEKKDA